MKTININEPKELLTQLGLLYKKGDYIFRGHSDARYKLIPNAFRPDKLKEAAENFPVAEKEIKQQWFDSEQVKKCICSWFPCAFKNALNYGRILRIFQLYIYIMRYNYCLHKYWQDNPEIICSEDKIKINMHSADFWSKEENFVAYVARTFPTLIQYFSIDGSLMIDAHPDEDLTGVDETFPQHYGVPTAALDWTYNPYIAIYFALDDGAEYDANRGLYIASKMPSATLSIYAYEKINDTINSPISVSNKLSNLKEQN